MQHPRRAIQGSRHAFFWNLLLACQDLLQGRTPSSSRHRCLHFLEKFLENLAANLALTIFELPMQRLNVKPTNTLKQIQMWKHVLQSISEYFWCFFTFRCIAAYRIILLGGFTFQKYMDTQEPALRCELQCAHCELQCSRTSRQYCAGETCNVWDVKEKSWWEEKRRIDQLWSTFTSDGSKGKNYSSFWRKCEVQFLRVCDVGLPLRGVRLCSPGDPDWTEMHAQKRYNRHTQANIHKDTKI